MAKFDNVEATVKWFDMTKGYGFFTTQAGDVFVHKTHLYPFGVTAEELAQAGVDGISAMISYEVRQEGRRQLVELHQLGDRHIELKPAGCSKV